MNSEDKFFFGIVGLAVVLYVAWWAFVAFVIYVLLAHFGIL